MPSFPKQPIAFPLLLAYLHRTALVLVPIFSRVTKVVSDVLNPGVSLVWRIIYLFEEGHQTSRAYPSLVEPLQLLSHFVFSSVSSCLSSKICSKPLNPLPAGGIGLTNVQLLRPLPPSCTWVLCFAVPRSHGAITDLMGPFQFRLLEVLFPGLTGPRPCQHEDPGALLPA